MSYLSVTKAIAVLEAEKRRLLAEKSGTPVVFTGIERVVVSPADNAIIKNAVAPASTPATTPPRPRKKPPEPAPPTYFTITTRRPAGADDVGAVSEGYFVEKDGKVYLCDAAGVPNGEGHAIEKPGVLYTARQMLRQQMAASRPPGPDHRPIKYPSTGWR